MQLGCAVAVMCLFELPVFFYHGRYLGVLCSERSVLNACHLLLAARCGLAARPSVLLLLCLCGAFLLGRRSRRGAVGRLAFDKRGDHRQRAIMS